MKIDHLAIDPAFIDRAVPGRDTEAKLGGKLAAQGKTLQATALGQRQWALFGKHSDPAATTQAQYKKAQVSRTSQGPHVRTPVLAGATSLKSKCFS
ncbi:hypothetical protein D3C75_950960 [compost metagenome]